MFGVVGSRKFNNRPLVETLVDRLPDKTVVVSGGCEGVDTWAVEQARPRLGTIVYTPKKKDKAGFFARNQRIAVNSDFVYAFIPQGQMKSGAWNTINWCRKHHVEYVVFNQHGEAWDRKWKSK